MNENNITNKENKCEVGEDATKYGEFVSSYFAWVSLPEQKEIVKRLENITKKDMDNKQKSRKTKRGLKRKVKEHKNKKNKGIKRKTKKIW